ncbi:MAG: hypothetical protein WC640_01600 [Candidatus Paceibacterota bacterium]|jgi:hypothetical protein
MIKEFFIKRQLKAMGVNGEQLEAMMKVVKKNPGLFQKLGQEIEDKVTKNKMGYQEAALLVAAKYKTELAKIFNQKS